MPVPSVFAAKKANINRIHLIYTRKYSSTHVAVVVVCMHMFK